uniref:DH domain-containing protein n=1 Tax=Strigamia maritima TaxID=126957 RepID=T1IGY5_STRMM
MIQPGEKGHMCPPLEQVLQHSPGTNETAPVALFFASSSNETINSCQENTHVGGQFNEVIITEREIIPGTVQPCVSSSQTSEGRVDETAHPISNREETPLQDANEVSPQQQEEESEGGERAVTVGEKSEQIEEDFDSSQLETLAKFDTNDECKRVELESATYEEVKTHVEVETKESRIDEKTIDPSEFECGHDYEAVGSCQQVDLSDYEEVEFVALSMGSGNSTDASVSCSSPSITDTVTFDPRRGLRSDVLYEVQRIERQHEQGLRQLSLDMETMINNNISASNGGRTMSQRELPSLPPERRSHLARILASPKSKARRDTVPVPVVKMDPVRTSTPMSKRKPWIRLPSLSRDKPHPESYSRVRESAVDEPEPVYMLYDDSHRQTCDGYFKDMNNIEKGNSSVYSDDDIYEDIEKSLNSNSVVYRQHNRSGMTHRSLEYNGEDFDEFEPYEDRSDNESEKSFGKVSLASIKKFTNAVTRRMSKSKDDRDKEAIMPSEKRQTLFPWRKEYDLEKSSHVIRKKLSQVAEEGHDGRNSIRMQNHPPCLPPMPAGLTPEQVKRRYIVTNLVHSENAYVAALKRILYDYKKSLEDSNPPILSKSKIDVLFDRVAEIQQCHAMFRIALTDCVRKWDKEERIGDVFIASFSKSMVLDMYSDFINNFSTAMELAKHESKRKSAFADFLKVKEITSHDRLSLFGLMVKPVQRFPQFILLLQDLLKHIPHDHHDRMNLQLALTQLESLAEMLNERKRESEQHHAVKELIHHVTTKFSIKSIAEGSKQQYLLRQDNFSQLKFDQDGQIAKSKDRRLYLLNELLVCVSVSQSSGHSLNNERYSLKWAVPVSDVEIQEELSPNLNRLLVKGLVKNRHSKGASDSAHALYQEMGDLMHDYEIFGRINTLVAGLKRNYDGFADLNNYAQQIIREIQEKDEEVKWIDNCCLQLHILSKNKNSKELITFQTNKPSITKEWITDLRMAQLALDLNNSPAWNISETELRPSTKMPLFVRATPVHSAPHNNEVKCACYYTCNGKGASSKSFNYLWVCSSDGVNSNISIMNLQQVNVKKICSFELSEVRISSMEPAPGLEPRETGLKGWTVWMGTDSRRILVYSGFDPERHENLGYIATSAPVLQLKRYMDKMYAGLANGNVVIFRQSEKGWCLKENMIVKLGSDAVTSLLPYKNCIYCACGRKVSLIDCQSGQVTKSFTINHEQHGNVYILAQSGIGLWINLRNTATVCLYHMETFKHLQDINIAANIGRSSENDQTSPRCIFVTSMLACRGLLWVGTNAGVALNIPLPRLEGVPIISGRASLSYHTLAGPVTTLLALTSPNTVFMPPKMNNDKGGTHTKLTKQTSCSSAPVTPKAPLRAQYSTPGLFAGKEIFNFTGIKPSISMASTLKISREDDEDSGINHTDGDYDVYGLYGDLMNIREYYDEGGESSLYESLRRSEPDLLLPTTISTLDRRLRVKAGRPKSLDLTNLAVTDPIYMSSSSDGDSSRTSSATSIAEPLVASPSKLEVSSEAPRTLLTIMGGRGYKDTRKHPNKNNSTVNVNDAYLLFWEMKL